MNPSPNRPWLEPLFLITYVRISKKALAAYRKTRRADNNDTTDFLGRGRSAAQWRHPKKDFTTEPTEVTEKRRTKKYGSTNKEP